MTIVTINNKSVDLEKIERVDCGISWHRILPIFYFLGFLYLFLRDYPDSFLIFSVMLGGALNFGWFGILFLLVNVCFIVGGFIYFCYLTLGKIYYLNIILKGGGIFMQGLTKDKMNLCLNQIRQSHPTS